MRLFLRTSHFVGGYIRLDQHREVLVIALNYQEVIKEVRFLMCQGCDSQTYGGTDNGLPSRRVINMHTPAGRDARYGDDVPIFYSNGETINSFIGSNFEVWHGKAVFRESFLCRNLSR